MDNRHRWDELLAEVNGEESPAQARQREIDELQKEQENDNYVSTVLGEFSDQPDANGRVFPEEVLREAFRDYPQNAGELVHQIEDLHREILEQQLVPDTIVVSPETAEMILQHNEQASVSARPRREDFGAIPSPSYDEYSRVFAPADAAASGLIRAGVEVYPGVFVQNPDHGLSVSDIVEEQSMVATASGLLFGPVVPNEVALPQELRLIGEPVVAPTFRQDEVVPWNPDTELPTLSGYNPFSRDWDI